MGGRGWCLQKLNVWRHRMKSSETGQRNPTEWAVASPQLAIWQWVEAVVQAPRYFQWVSASGKRDRTLRALA